MTPQQYRTRLIQLRTIVEELIAGHIEYQDLTDIDSIPIDPRKCMTVQGTEQSCKVILPIHHLVTGIDNRILYPTRISDELLRYRRIRLFLLDPNYYLNLATVSSTAYDIASDEILVLESALTPEFLRGLVPLSSSGKYVHRTNYDTALPSVMSETYTNRLSTEQQRELLGTNEEEEETDNRIATSTLLPETMRNCVLNVHGIVGGTHGMWKQSFPTTTREMDFNLSPNSPECFFSPLVYVLRRIGYNMAVEEDLGQVVRKALVAGYTRYMVEHEDKLRRILTNQGKSMAAANKQPRYCASHNCSTSSLLDIVSDPNYYLTDLDLWIVCQELKLPVVLFSSTKLKHMVDVKWLYLGTDPDKGPVPTITTPLYFVRSPPNVPKDTPPAYSMLTEPYAYGQLKEVGAQLRMGFEGMSGASTDNPYQFNVQSLDTFLRDFKVVAARR